MPAVALAFRITFDGKATVMLNPSDSIRMTVAKWPLPMITAETRDQDWFTSITEKLMWNTIIKVDRKRMQMAPLPAPSVEYAPPPSVLLQAVPCTQPCCTIISPCFPVLSF